MRGWYLTEDEGRVLGLYGSSTPFRYLVPWGTVDECIRYLGAHGDRAPGSLLVFGDDGEKFGGWPTTFAHCWEEGWVDAFFGRLEQESHWLETVHLGAWRKERPPVSRAYLPAASYMEMAQWSLPPAAQMQLENARAILRSNGRDDLTQFVRGGHWRNFLVRYPEVNLLHKRLLALSVVAHEKNDKEALEAIWKAQCNCPWWHGVFGGVYLEHIRHANFAHLAAADAALYGGPQAPEVRDWDYDGRDEVCLRSEEHLVVVDPDDSGTLLHWELRTVPWHLTHVVARRPEAYHAELTTNHDEGVHSIHDGTRLKDPGALAVANVYDRGMRLAAQETILPTGATREHYAAERLSGPPSGNEWHVGEDGSVFVTSIREGLPPITRRVSLAMGLQVRTEGAPDESIFSEWNLSLPDDASAPTTITLEPGVASIRSALFSLTARHSGDDSWYERVFAASNTEEGVALEPQGWSIVFRGCGSLEVTWQKE